MITKTDITKMIKHVARRSRRIPDRRLMHPGREWSIGVIVFFLVLIVGGVFSASRFVYFSGIESQLEDSDVSVVEYQEATMRETLQFFNDRTLRFQQIRNGITPVTTQAEEAASEQSDETIEAGSEAEVTTEPEVDEVVVEEGSGDEEVSSGGGLDVE